MDILLIGSQGKMGKIFCDIIAQSTTDRIVAGVDIQNNNEAISPYFSHTEHKTIWSVKEKYDLIVDFSTSGNKKELIDFALLFGVPLAVFSTTCSEEDKSMLLSASKHIPILLCSNTSIGVNAMFEALDILAERLKGSDIVIEEYHHKQKLDSPSGTAKTMIDILCKQGANKPQLNVSRVGNECGYHSIKFFMDGEIVTLSHRANSKKIFALGAYNMIKKLKDKKSGYFTKL